MSPPRFAVIGASELVTMRGPARARVGREMRDLAIIQDGALIVRAGRIEAVGARAEIEPLIGPRCEVVDAGGRVVMPGFVDAHTHPVFAGNRANEWEMRAAGLTYQEIGRGEAESCRRSGVPALPARMS